VSIFQPVPDTIEVAIQGEYDGQLVENLVYAQADATVTADMVVEIATIVADWVASTFFDSVGVGYSHRRVVATDVSTPASFQTINTEHAGETGTVGGQALPGNCCIAVHRNTGLSGKKAKSRIYHPALTGTMLATADTMNGGSSVLIVAAWDALRSAIEAGISAGFIYGYPQRVLNAVRLGTANFIQVFAHSMVDLFLDSQRRRLEGRGA
jgi:hypothetical protein